MKRILCMAAALVAAAGIARAAGEGDGWKLGLQAWTLNKLTFAEAADQAAKLGLKYIESFPGQAIGGGIEGKMVCDMDAATQGKVLAMLKEKGVTVINYGVAGASGEAGWRALFAWAKAMGIEFVKAKVARISEDEDHNAVVRIERQEDGGRPEEVTHDLVVLSLGMVPAWKPTPTRNGSGRCG